ncbi:hypothetical protein CVS40_9022 [Lucilia cuprina]|nr:hypothetical protein CVS40_9022 [Lucilia cuprina]KAI8119742.1 hypothetical protein CVS40_9022 [Lucilia cuprina]
MNILPIYQRNSVKVSIRACHQNQFVLVAVHPSPSRVYLNQIENIVQRLLLKFENFYRLCFNLS